MSILTEVLDNIKQAFEYWKPRTRNKALGDKFEEWVVLHSNCQRAVRKDKNDDGEKKYVNYWDFLSWSSDKYFERENKEYKLRYYADTNLQPDLIFQANKECPSNSHGDDRKIAVECKFTPGDTIFIKQYQLRRYAEFNEKNKIANFYFVLGYGYKSFFSNTPKDVFLVKGQLLIDQKIGNIKTFDGKGSLELKLDTLLKMNIIEKRLDCSDSKNLMYHTLISMVHYIP